MNQVKAKLVERQPLLEITGLSVSFNKGADKVKAVDNVSLSVSAGETLGLVGESGCGKSTLARSIIRLQSLDSGTITFQGQPFHALQGAALRKARRDMQMVFQDPYSSLNPRMKIADIVADPLRNNSDMSPAATQERVLYLLDRVGLPMRAAAAYPHELSGGQRQRVGIARALALDPKFIICDEAISALDVSIQAQIINLLQDLQESMELTYLFIAHDIAVVRHICTRIAVMYLGQIVEIGTAEQICDAPQHPYTKALLSAVPVPDPIRERKRYQTTQAIRGEISKVSHEGCKFASRCPVRDIAMQTRKIDCSAVAPELINLSSGHFGACHLLAGNAPSSNRPVNAAVKLL
ncbi:ABC transporter ATP-binding protein [Aminobacter sp. Piv2-1]|uniref:ABC transporter ATP-binding protein n=1 Tax=Aminobacter sp. Piv2-1 TaxID=3031122 RepID=UPI0030A50DE3